MSGTLQNDDEIDLFELVETLWDGKWKIILSTVVAAALGLVFTFLKPNTYEGVAPVRKASSSYFTKYVSVNSLLHDNGFDYRIDPDSVFELFVSEFNDYEELVAILEQDPYTLTLLEKSNPKVQKTFLLSLAKNFVIVPPKAKDGEWSIRFEWHNAEEGMRIYSQALKDVLDNVRVTVLSDVDELALAVSSVNERKGQTLNSKIEVLRNKAELDLKQRLLFLREQSVIAKALGIETNVLDGGGLMQSQNSSVSLSVNSAEVPFYLRGYKAIDKEIEVTLNRTEEDLLLMNQDYMAAKEQLAFIENSVSAEQILSVTRILEKDDYSRWVNFDLSLADINSQNRPLLYLALSVLLGGMLGAIYVLLSNALRKRKIAKASA